MIGLLLLWACQGADKGSDSAPSTQPASGLEQFGLLDWDGASFTYGPGVVPYELATPLFSDHAVKRRAIRLPEGSTATWLPGDQILDLPVGTVLLKSFLFPADLRAPDADLRVIETRILSHTAEGWQAEPWLWNDAGTDAALAPSGATLPIAVVGLDGASLTIPYLVPQKNQCVDCHELVDDDDDKRIVPIGPKARHLNRSNDYGDGPVNQLEQWTAVGILQGLPPIDQVEAATDARTLEGVDLDSLPYPQLEAAARDYLDINCAHCHNPAGTEGISSQLFLHRGATEPFDLGVCKRPGSAGLGNGGLTYDIVPGDHTQSILWFRMDTEQVGAMMPDIGRSVRDPHGADLVARWIDGMEPDDCQ